MATSGQLLSIFQYLDYRKYLKDYFAYQKSLNPNFSNRTFARKAGLPLNNTSLVSKIMLGKRNLTQALRFKFSLALDLKGDELRFFELLVQFNQSKEMQEKNYFYSEISKYAKPKARIMQQLQYRIHEKWYYHVVRAYFGIHQKEKNAYTIARNIYPNLTPEQVEEAIQTLLELNLIEKTANGYAVTEPHITSARQTRDKLGKIQIREMTRLALEVFDQLPAALREYNSMTMYMSEKCFKTIRERIRSFREELRALLDNDEDEDRIYTLTMHFFPNNLWPGSILRKKK
jgi:uncharacterized protein (TIGR02147 family)